MINPGQKTQNVPIAQISSDSSAAHPKFPGPPPKKQLFQKVDNNSQNPRNFTVDDDQKFQSQTQTMKKPPPALPPRSKGTAASTFETRPVGIPMKQTKNLWLNNNNKNLAVGETAHNLGEDDPNNIDSQSPPSLSFGGPIQFSNPQAVESFWTPNENMITEEKDFYEGTNKTNPIAAPKTVMNAFLALKQLQEGIKPQTNPKPTNNDNTKVKNQTAYTQNLKQIEKVDSFDVNEDNTMDSLSSSPPPMTFGNSSFSSTKSVSPIDLEKQKEEEKASITTRTKKLPPPIPHKTNASMNTASSVMQPSHKPSFSTPSFETLLSRFQSNLNNSNNTDNLFSNNTRSTSPPPLSFPKTNIPSFDINKEELKMPLTARAQKQPPPVPPKVVSKTIPQKQPINIPNNQKSNNQINNFMFDNKLSTSPPPVAFPAKRMLNLAINRTNANNSSTPQSNTSTPTTATKTSSTFSSTFSSTSSASTTPSSVNSPNPSSSFFNDNSKNNSPKPPVPTKAHITRVGAAAGLITGGQDKPTPPTSSRMTQRMTVTNNNNGNDLNLNGSFINLSAAVGSFFVSGNNNITGNTSSIAIPNANQDKKNQEKPKAKKTRNNFKRFRPKKERISELLSEKPDNESSEPQRPQNGPRYPISAEMKEKFREKYISSQAQPNLYKKQKELLLNLAKMIRIRAEQKVTKKKLDVLSTRESNAREILSTEETFVSSMKVLRDVYYTSLKEILEKNADKNNNTSFPLTNEMLVNIFSGVEQIIQYNSLFLEKLRSKIAIQNNVDNFSHKSILSDAFFWLYPFLRVFKHYCAKYDTGLSDLKKLRKENKYVLEKLKECDSNPVTKRLGILSFLILPVQRIPRYRLLLQDLLKNTNKDHPDYSNLCKALENIKEVADEINSVMKKAERSNKLVKIQSKFFPNTNITLPHRIFLDKAIFKTYEENPNNYDNENFNNDYNLQFSDSRWIFLFNDVLIVAKKGKSSVPEYLDTIKLAEVHVFDHKPKKMKPVANNPPVSSNNNSNPNGADDDAEYHCSMNFNNNEQVKKMFDNETNRSRLSVTRSQSQKTMSISPVTKIDVVNNKGKHHPPTASPIPKKIITKFFQITSPSTNLILEASKIEEKIAWMEKIFIACFKQRQQNEDNSADPKMFSQNSNKSNKEYDDTLSLAVQRSQNRNSSNITLDVDPEMCLAIMKKGSGMLKYCRKTKPHFRKFILSQDEKKLTWFSPNKDQKNSTVNICEITTIFKGQMTKQFMKYKDEYKEIEDQSFSIMFGGRTLDIVTTNKYQFHIWTTGMQYLVTSLKDPNTRKGKKRPTPEEVSKFYTDEEEIFSNEKNIETTFANSYTGIFGLNINFSEKLQNLNFGIAGSITKGFGNVIGEKLGLGELKGNSDFLKIGDSYSWGEGYKGGLGQGSNTTEDINEPRVMKDFLFLDVVFVCAGEHAGCVLTQEGEVFTFGANECGKLGHGNNTDYSKPTMVKVLDGERIKQVAMGQSHTLFLDSKGQLFGCGSNQRGQLGLDVSRIQELIPISSSGNSSNQNSERNSKKKKKNRKKKNQISEIGQDMIGNTGVIISDSEDDSDNSSDSEGNKSEIGNQDESGDLNSSGSDSDSEKDAVGMPEQVLSAEDIERQQKVNNSFFTPIIITSIDFGDNNKDDKIILVKAGANHSGAVTKNGQLFMFGANDEGQLGLGFTSKDEFQPKKVDLPGQVVSIALGTWHTLAALDDGSVWAWGSNNNGQLGINSKEENVSTPRKISNFGSLSSTPHEKVKSVACGSLHSAFITESGQLYLFGNGGYGQLGNGKKETAYCPLQVAFFNPKEYQVLEIACGSNHCIAIAAQKNPTSKTIANNSPAIAATNNNNYSKINCYGWGAGLYGRLGLGNEEEALIPTENPFLKNKTIRSVAAGGTISLCVCAHQWIPDAEIKNCMNPKCRSEFTLLNRRHHCRYCGGIFCAKCTPYKIMLLRFGFASKQRVCFNCYQILRKKQ